MNGRTRNDGTEERQNNNKMILQMIHPDRKRERNTEGKQEGTHAREQKAKENNKQTRNTNKQDERNNEIT